jgi:hypothetical protein
MWAMSAISRAPARGAGITTQQTQTGQLDGDASNGTRRHTHGVAIAQYFARAAQSRALPSRWQLRASQQRRAHSSAARAACVAVDQDL